MQDGSVGIGLQLLHRCVDTSHNDLLACTGFGKLEHFEGVHNDSGSKLHQTLNQLTSSVVEDCRVVSRTPHTENTSILVDDLICLGVIVYSDTNSRQKLFQWNSTSVN